MRASLVALVTLVASAAAAEEPGPFSLRLGGGGVVGTGAVLDAAPALELSAALALSPTFGLFAGGSGWSLSNAGPIGGRSELFLSAGGTMRGPIAGALGWALAAGPALAVIDEAAAPVVLRPALVVAPALELGTRRRSLSLRLGAQAAAFADGLRVMAGVGVGYAF